MLAVQDIFLDKTFVVEQITNRLLRVDKDVRGQLCNYSIGN